MRAHVRSYGALGFICSCCLAHHFYAQFYHMMASQPVRGREDITSLEVQSYIRGHSYQDVWDPRIGEVLPLQWVPNLKTSLKTSLLLPSWGGVLRHHLPFNLAPVVSAFLRLDVNTGLAEVTGAKFNRGAGYGLEIPCFYRSKSFVDKLNQLVASRRRDGRL